MFFSANIQPNIVEYDGTYNYDARKHILQWSIPVIDANNKMGSMEFSCNSSIPKDFFPVQVSLYQILASFSILLARFYRKMYNICYI